MDPKDHLDGKTKTSPRTRLLVPPRGSDLHSLTLSETPESSVLFQEHGLVM